MLEVSIESYRVCMLVPYMICRVLALVHPPGPTPPYHVSRQFGQICSGDHGLQSPDWDLRQYRKVRRVREDQGLLIWTIIIDSNSHSLDNPTSEVKDFPGTNVTVQL